MCGKRSAGKRLSKEVHYGTHPSGAPRDNPEPASPSSVPLGSRSPDGGTRKRTQGKGSGHPAADATGGAPREAGSKEGEGPDGTGSSPDSCLSRGHSKARDAELERAPQGSGGILGLQVFQRDRDRRLCGGNLQL